MAYYAANFDSLFISPMDEVDPYATGERLRNMRKIVHKCSQEALSEALEIIGFPVSIVMISHWENGKLPNLIHLLALAHLYGCRVDDLLVRKVPNAQGKAA